MVVVVVSVVVVFIKVTFHTHMQVMNSTCLSKSSWSISKIEKVFRNQITLKKNTDTETELQRQRNEEKIKFLKKISDYLQ